MGRLLYVSFGNASTPGRGVTKKINSQLKVFQRTGIETMFVSGYNDKLAIYQGNAESEPTLIKLSGGTRKQLAKWISVHAEEFDYAYIRFQFFDYFFNQMLKRLKEKNVKIVVEIPTYPYIDELKGQGLKGTPKIVIDTLFSGICKQKIDRFTSPAYEGSILGSPVIPMKNGIEIDSVQMRSTSIAEDGTISLLAVASMSPWHGYERVIEGMREYYSHDYKRVINLHMVGEGVELDHYKQLVKEYNLQDRITFWGRLSGAPLDEVYNICQIGVCALGTYKHNILKTNALKTLEYLAKGMPVICDTSEVALPVNHKYRMNVPMDRSPVNIDEVIHFYESVFENGKPITEVEISIRNECRANCSFDSGMRHVVNYFID